MTSLRELQISFAAALRGAPETPVPGVIGRGLDPAARVQIYRHNVEAVFEGALAGTYPVLKRRVGERYFARLAHRYRASNPSRRGDLHWVGQGFPAFLSEHEKHTPYAWLSDLARLEWACEEALVAADAAPASVQVLARFMREDLGDLRFTLQPSTRCVASSYPVLAAWLANQSAPGAAVDLESGAANVVLRSTRDGLRLYDRTHEELAFVEHLLQGGSLGAAAEKLAPGTERLAAVLDWLFTEEFVTGVAA